MTDPDSHPPPARQRVIALGASNLTRMLPCLTRVARGHANAPVDVIAALGFGRSFGKRSRFLGRDLLGIDSCGLWSALPDLRDTDSRLVDLGTGMILDVGNDIFYNVLPDTVLEWVGRSLDRLKPHVNRLVLAGVPPPVADIGNARYQVMRKILVPSCKMELGEGLRRAAALHEGLRSLANEHNATFVEHPYHWFGWDAIHVKRRYWRAFSKALLGIDGDQPVAGGVSSLRLRTAAPDRRWVFGRERTTPQPAVRLRDGSTVALY